MHLVIDTELNTYPIPENVKGKVFYAKHVRLEYSDTTAWDDK